MGDFTNTFPQDRRKTCRIRLYPQHSEKCPRPGYVSDKKRTLLKTLSSVETFENATNPDTCGRTVTGTF